MPCFLATPSTAQSFTGGAAAVVLTCDTEIYDNTNSYNPATSTFTAPVAGIYEFIIQAVASNGTSSRLLPSLKVNATMYNGSQQTDTFSSGIIILPVKLNAGDTVVPYGAFNPATGSTTALVANTRFSGKRIG